MLARALGAGIRRTVLRAAAAAAVPAASTRLASQWLQGKPPAVDVNAGTMAAFFYKNVREFDTPSKDALVSAGQDQKFTMEQFDHIVYAYAKGMLHGLGVKKGSKIALWMTDEAEHLIMRYAAGLVGTTVVSIDPHTVGWEGVKSILAAEGCRALVFSSRVGTEMRSEAVSAQFAAEVAPHKQEWGTFPIASKTFRELKWLVQTGFEPVPGVLRMKDLPVHGLEGEHEFDEVAAVQAYISKADAATVDYSAAGAAGATMSHAQLLELAGKVQGALKLQMTDTLAVTAPLGTSTGFVACLAGAAANAKLVVTGRAFNAKKVLAALTLQRATALVATEEQAAALSAALAADAGKEFDLSSLKGGLLVGGAKAAATLGAASLKPF